MDIKVGLSDPGKKFSIKCLNICRDCARFVTLLFLPSIDLQSCDLWSLGVIIYVMLCGYPPFYSKHHSRTIPKDMRKKIMTGSFDFPEDEWSQISEMAKDIVRK